MIIDTKNKVIKVRDMEIPFSLLESIVWAKANGVVIMVLDSDSVTIDQDNIILRDNGSEMSYSKGFIESRYQDWLAKHLQP